ncbi:MAG: AAA family ATPase [Actinobacteria bacterium]|nr:AAA family ATPase [Actinomycetota bacterium]MCL6105557.1 AAA family ATPase [Actinomycetota bacterium]
MTAKTRTTSPGDSASLVGLASLDGLLASKEIAVFCGPGGVGKTTTAAAAALMAAAKHGGKVLVLTVDPAKRLANALGLSGIGNTETKISKAAFEAAGISGRGELWAAMLDTKQSWDDLIKRHAPDEEVKERILSNPLYQNISGHFVQSHDYIAMERLYEIHTEGDFDLIVVDTPPTRNAIDFLEAPERMSDFFSSRLLRWLIAPYRSKFINFASRPFYQVADRILGTQFLGDISEFFILFQSMYEGFAERAEAVSKLIQDSRTTFLVVSTLETFPIKEAEFFVDALLERNLSLGAIILNKVLPDYFRSTKAISAAEQLDKQFDKLANELLGKMSGAGKDGAGVLGGLNANGDLSRVFKEVGESFLNFSVVAKKEAEQAKELALSSEITVKIPFFDTDIYDLAGLAKLGRSMWS